MTPTRLMLLNLVIAVIAVLALSGMKDGMATCQMHHSFDVCHHALVR